MAMLRTCALCPWAVLVIAAGMLAAADQAHGGVWYVNGASPNANGTGLSWAQACRTVPEALAKAAAANDPAPDIWITAMRYDVAPGTYLDLPGTPFTSVVLRGGFLGNETSHSQRPLPSATPPESLVDGTRFVARLSEVTRFLRTQVDVTLERITIQSFRDVAAGAAAEVVGATLTLREVLIFGVDSTGNGGAIHASGGAEVVALSSRFQGIQSGTGVGGAGGALWAGPQCRVEIRDSVFYQCYAQHTGGDGGAVYISADGQATIDRSAFYDCQASTGGGAVYTGHRVTATISDCQFATNYAPQGGAVRLEGDGSAGQPLVTIVRSTFNRHFGDAVYALRTRLLLEGCTFANNRMQVTSTGALEVVDTALEAVDCTFEGNRNTAPGGRGGAVYLHPAGTPTDTPAAFVGCTFRGNRAVFEGGAIYMSGNLATLTQCRFEGNSVDETGGAVSVVLPGGGGAPLVVTASVFVGNSSATTGGALRSQRPVEIRRTQFLRNYAGDKGAALEAFGTGAVTLDNCVFAYNGSNAVYLPFSEGISAIRHCTFFENLAGNLVGGALEINRGSNNTFVIANNVFVQSKGSVALLTGISNYTAVSNLVTPGKRLLGFGESAGEPAFLDPVRGDFRLASPAFAEGQGAALGIQVDLRNAARPQGSGIDIGAYEYTPAEDRDGDELTDVAEGNGDSDGDGIPNYLDNDGKGTGSATDVNRDGNHDAIDIQLVINAALGL